MKFKVNDKVRRVDGGCFGNFGDETAMVECIDDGVGVVVPTENGPKLEFYEGVELVKA